MHRKSTFSLHFRTHLHSRARFSMHMPSAGDLEVSQLTATNHLDALAAGGFVQKVKLGRSNYYVNQTLNAILARAEMVEGAQG